MEAGSPREPPKAPAAKDWDRRSATPTLPASPATTARRVVPSRSHAGDVPPHHEARLFTRSFQQILANLRSVRPLHHSPVPMARGGEDLLTPNQSIDEVAPCTPTR